MPIHDRRLRSKSVDEKFANAKYSSLYQSQHFETLKDLVGLFIAKWQVEQGTGSTMDEYLMSSLRRDGRIEALRLLLKEIESLSNPVDN